MPYSYEFPRPSVTVDSVVFGYEPSSHLAVLLIRRSGEPFRGFWALPGGFVDMDESLETAARRELLEETGIEVGSFEQFGTFGDVNRDPRGRVISVAYYGLVRRDSVQIIPGSDAGEVGWIPIRDALNIPMAFDHRQVLQIACQRLHHSIQSLESDILPSQFTFGDMQQLDAALIDEAMV